MWVDSPPPPGLTDFKNPGLNRVKKHSLFGVFSLPYLTKQLFEITQILTQNTKWGKKDACLVCLLNFFEMNVKELLLLGSKFCDTELR